MTKFYIENLSQTNKSNYIIETNQLQDVEDYENINEFDYITVVLKNIEYINNDINYDYMNLIPGKNNKYFIKKDHGKYKFFYYLTIDSADIEE